MWGGIVTIVQLIYRYAAIRDTILPYPDLPCEISLQISVKIMVHVLAADRQ